MSQANFKLGQNDFWTSQICPYNLNDTDCQNRMTELGIKRVEPTCSLDLTVCPCHRYFIE